MKSYVDAQKKRSSAGAAYSKKRPRRLPSASLDAVFETCGGKCEDIQVVSTGEKGWKVPASCPCVITEKALSEMEEHKKLLAGSADAPGPLSQLRKKLHDEYASKFNKGDHAGRLEMALTDEDQ